MPCQSCSTTIWRTATTTASQVSILQQSEESLFGTNPLEDSILWPLFHYHPGEITFDESAWSAYTEANRLFAKAIAKDVEDNDMVWVHDYHLMLLPAMLREEIGNTKKNVKLGFFLHTPFPSSEIYRILPVRNEILLGVLHCDLIGFHTYDYARHFLSSCSRIL
jgi:trehalose 6-phosphate synthase